ncbi:hypothetical protein MSPP1_002264 [Malassezia sp. CBS 17886]|nr:hypothetical protein MSPP1_002264 [Malassezia sp. CBS 17886]
MALARAFAVVVFIALCLHTVAAMWDKDDIEIFELQAALEQSEGTGINFYSIMGLSPGSALPEIRKAYREKSLEWHPDKNQDMPDAHKRFERLGLIHRILRDERRDRYDHFLSNGFPKWRGTGYFYERFRPGLALVLVLVVALSVAVQYTVKRYNWRRGKEQLEALRRSALAAAWGAWFQTPTEAKMAGMKPKTRPLEKKVRVPLFGFDGMPPAPAADAVAAGRVDWEQEGYRVREAMNALAVRNGTDAMAGPVDVTVYRDGSLSVFDPTKDLWFPLEMPQEADAPSLFSTWPCALVRHVTARKPADAEVDADVNDEAVVPPPVADTPTTTTTTSKAAAKRRKRGKKN